jgi:uncharacterized protein YecE (DUF72 family)
VAIAYRSWIPRNDGEVRQTDEKRQLSLFGPELSARDKSGQVGPAAVTDALKDVARKLPSNIFFGTSSWSFPGWEGLVYDRRASKAQLAKNGLAAYAQHPLLRAVGIDRTFYAPIGAAEFAAYAAAVPDAFRFLVKAPSLCTTPLRRNSDGRSAGANELFLDPAFAIEQIVAPFVEGLGPKAGPLVFQFPPLGSRWTREPARFAVRLGAFLAALPRGPLYAVELRDLGLFGPEYLAALNAVGASHCLNIHPRAQPASDQRLLCDSSAEGTFVARWMLGSGQGYDEALRRYEPFSKLVDEDLGNRELLAETCLEHALRGREVVLVANNKAEGSAPLTVFRLAEEIVRRMPET